MKKTKIHLFLIIMITFAGLLLTADSIMEGWEFWVNPILIGGLIVIWILHIGQLADEKVREVLYLIYVMFLALFHGVHPSSFFDVCSVISLCMVLFSLYDRLYVLNIFLGEYFILIGMQFYTICKDSEMLLNSESAARYILQVFIVLSIYMICRTMINGRLEQVDEVEQAKDEKEQNDIAMEDFLSNISHELRTPVNVVNGMSMLMLKQNESDELIAIKNAGLRLSYQIEDIQDYTEVKRKKLILEEENYMITSLVNDVVTDFRRYAERDELELVIDLDPNVPSMLKGDVKKLKKMLRHLLDNGVKFTKHGGIYIKVFAIPRDYGVNLTIEVTDTGIGMKRKDISMVSSRMYQANRKRNRSSGGIGLGLTIVYGMAHKMGGFVKIDAQVGTGTTVRVTVPQIVVDPDPCLRVDLSALGDVIFHVRAGKYKVPAVRDFYRDMATNLATGIRKPLFSADSLEDVKHLMEKMNVSHIFMGEEEYEEDREFFDKLSTEGITVAVSAKPGFKADETGNVIVMPKPMYGYPAVKLLNGENISSSAENPEGRQKLLFENVRALIVDDEPMNLVVATGLFREYRMQTDTAESGREAIDKFTKKDYDIIFMDHMMPEMDGVEAMKLLKEEARRQGRGIIVVALTANAVSGAREMFLKEGFDGFIAKPVDVAEFERVMRRVLGNRTGNVKGGAV